MSQAVNLYEKLTSKHDRAGRGAFSVAFSLKAPYFRTVRPHVLEMEPHHASVRIAKRWGVTNHIGTIHAIAVANGMECAMGLLAEATTPSSMRWIPKGIQLDYLAKVDGDVDCIATTTPADWAHEPPFTVDVRVRGVVRHSGVTAVEGIIPIHVSARR